MIDVKEILNFIKIFYTKQLIFIPGQHLCSLAEQTTKTLFNLTTANAWSFILAIIISDQWFLLPQLACWEIYNFKIYFICFC